MNAFACGGADVVATIGSSISIVCCGTTRLRFAPEASAAYASLSYVRRTSPRPERNVAALSGSDGARLRSRRPVRLRELHTAAGGCPRPLRNQRLQDGPGRRVGDEVQGHVRGGRSGLAGAAAAASSEEREGGEEKR